MELSNNSTPVNREISPPLSLLLPCYGTAFKDNEITKISNLDQWLWYFYLTCWPRSFFAQTSSLLRVSHNTNNNSNNIEVELSSFEKSLRSMEFPAAVAITQYEKQWGQYDNLLKEEVKKKSKIAVENIDNSLYPPIPRVDESCFGNVFRSLCVRDYISGMNSSSSKLSLKGLLQETIKIVQYKQNEKIKRITSVINVENEDELIKNALQIMFSSDINSIHHNLIFDVEPLEVKNKEQIIKEVHCSRLFSAISVEVFGRVKSACVRILLAYINEGCNNDENNNNNNNNITGKISITTIASARACGVIMGIIEYAITYHFNREDKTGRCSLYSAALLLNNLVEIQNNMLKDNKGLISGSLLATIIISCIQELIFTIIVGGPSTHHRSSYKNINDSNKLKNKNNEHQQNEEISIHPIVLRALTLNEMDAVLQSLFPALLQQIGFEWPWSETLRHSRTLDKIEQGEMMISNGVRLTSNAVFGEILFVISRRTYANRLRCILPQSFDNILNSVFPIEEYKNNSNNEEGSKSNKNEKRSRFIMPNYYRAAGEALIEFFERSGLSGTTAAETERVLQRNTDIQPMIIQLQALSNRTDNDNNNNEEEEDINNINDNSDDLLSTVRLTEYEKHRLLLRYRCEVLLASLIVYTQLQTVSFVQQLMRQLAPLFEKLLLPLLYERTLTRSFIIKNKRRQNGKENITVDKSVDFTPEFKVLMDEIHYEFYPLEWIPDVMNVYLKGSHYNKKEEEDEEDIVPPAFYSVFAAVAYQFGILFQTSPYGLRGGEISDAAVRDKAYRFFMILLLNTLTDSVASSCDLEGASAVAATRRVGANRQEITENDRIELQKRGATSFHSAVNPHDVIFALIQCMLPAELVSRPVVKKEEDNSQSISGEWLHRVLEWTQSSARRVTMTQKIPSTTLPYLFSSHNSDTFDAIPLAREVIRGLRRRLVEKLHLKIATEEVASPDPLLQQHLFSLQSLLEFIGLLTHNDHQNNDILSAERLLWSSPLFSYELLLSGRYNTRNT